METSGCQTVPQKPSREPEQAVAAVAASIREFGFRQPIVVDEAGVIIVGHTRWKAAQLLELKVVPVHVATGLSKAQVKAYRLADNKTGELADWDHACCRESCSNSKKWSSIWGSPVSRRRN